MAVRNGHPVVDSDGHTYEPEDLYDRYLDPQYRRRVRTVGRVSMGKWIREVDGKLTGMLNPAELEDPDGPLTVAKVMAQALSAKTYEARYGEAFLTGWDGASVGRAQQAEGVDISVIYGPGYDVWLKDMDPALAAAMAQAYSRWLAQYREDSGGVIRGAAPLPLGNVDLALKVLEHAYTECGIRAFWARPNPINGRLVGDRSYDPLYEAIQALDVPIGFHTFSGSELPEAGRDRAVCGWVDGHVYLHPYEQQMAMVDMIVRGAFDRFPRLRVGFLEAGCAWVGWLLDRVHEHMEFARWQQVTGLEQEPWDYFRRNCFLTTECEERLVWQAVEVAGDENILFATDYPHVDAINNYPGYVDAFLSHPRLSEVSKRRILWDNAQRYYKFPESALPTDMMGIESGAEGGQQ
jgi:predicted TIM-barrel fold metal-dependent hydrolase